MARPRKPTAIKKLQGTLQPCRTNKDEPVISIDIKQIEPPEYLDDKAKDIWRFAVEQCPEGMLTSIDFSILAQWADTVAKIIVCEKVLQREGMFIVKEPSWDKEGTPIAHPHPMLKTQNELKFILKSILTELGFTPASRSKVSCVKKTDENRNGFLDL